MIFAGIVAGGLGTRLGSEIPKQFLTIGTKPIIVHTIEKFLLCSQIDMICVGIHEDWIPYAEDVFKKYNLNSERIMISCGGRTRNDTIMSIVSSIESKFGESDDHIIITHDAVRPFVSLKIIEKNIEYAKKYDACDTVVSSHDTIVKSDMSQCEIINIPNRKFMFLGQTPQSFNINKLKYLFNKLSESQKSELTDACKIFTINGEQVYLVMGEFSNMKITTVIDYKIAKSLLEDNFD